MHFASFVFITFVALFHWTSDSCTIQRHTQILFRFPGRYSTRATTQLLLATRWKTFQSTFFQRSSTICIYAMRHTTRARKKNKHDGKEKYEKNNTHTHTTPHRYNAKPNRTKWQTNEKSMIISNVCVWLFWVLYVILDNIPDVTLIIYRPYFCTNCSMTFKLYAFDITRSFPKCVHRVYTIRLVCVCVCVWV